MVAAAIIGVVCILAILATILSFMGVLSNPGKTKELEAKVKELEALNSLRVEERMILDEAIRRMVFMPEHANTYQEDAYAEIRALQTKNAIERRTK